jgi:hypothetical protein
MDLTGIVNIDDEIARLTKEVTRYDYYSYIVL